MQDRIAVGHHGLASNLTRDLGTSYSRDLPVCHRPGPDMDVETTMEAAPGSAGGCSPQGGLLDDWRLVPGVRGGSMQQYPCPAAICHYGVLCVTVPGLLATRSYIREHSSICRGFGSFKSPLTS